MGQRASSKLSRHDDALPSYDIRAGAPVLSAFNSGFVVHARRLRAELCCARAARRGAQPSYNRWRPTQPAAAFAMERAKVLDALGCTGARSGEAAQAAQLFDEPPPSGKRRFAAEHPLRRRHEGAAPGRPGQVGDDAVDHAHAGQRQRALGQDLEGSCCRPWRHVLHQHDAA